MPGCTPRRIRSSSMPNSAGSTDTPWRSCHAPPRQRSRSRGEQRVRKLVDEGVVAVLGRSTPRRRCSPDPRRTAFGGIPVNNDEMVTVSFQFSGSPGRCCTRRWRSTAAEVAVLCGVPAIEMSALQYGADVAEALGAEVSRVSFPMVSQDFAFPVQKAVEGKSGRHHGRRSEYIVLLHA